MFERKYAIAAVALCALFAMPVVAAPPIFKCVDASGAVSFQSTACADGAAQSDVKIRDDTATPAPPSKYNPRRMPVINLNRTSDTSSTASVFHPPAPGNNMPPPNPIPSNPRDQSYECRATNGEVFYRHDGCPDTIQSGSSTTVDYVRGRITETPNQIGVTSRQVSREEACRSLNRAGAIGRSGHARDQQVSTYDKNLGRDPCK